jgi:hypothetical protein
MSAPGTDVIEVNPFLPDDLPDLIGGVEEEVARAQELAESIEVGDDAQVKAALKCSQEFNRRLKAIEDERISLTKPRKDAAEEIKRRFDAVKAPYKAADKVIRDKISAHNAEERRKAEEEQRRIEEQRRKAEAKAVAERQAAEKAEREAAELAQEAEDDGDVRAAQELAEEAKREAQSAQVMEQAVQSLPPQAPAVAPKLDGFSERTKWEAFVTDEAALPDRLPDGTPLKVVDMVALRRHMNEVRNATGSPPTLPGAEFKQVPSGTAVRT